MRRARSATVMGLLGLYLALSLVIPRQVPRLWFLPAPQARTTYEDCGGHRGASTREEWFTAGPFWAVGRWTVGGACITA